MRQKILSIWGYKDLLINLTTKELKLKYKNSVLGFFWSLLNPLMLLIVYTFAFKYIFKQNIDNFSLFVLSGLLPWSFFQGSIMGGTNSIVANGNLIKKVYFPREIVTLSIILSNFINFLMTFLILIIAVLVSDIRIDINIIFIPINLFLLLLLTSGLSLGLAALNVIYRDILHFVEIVFMAWFYITPIVYSTELIPGDLKLIINLNPLTAYIESLRDILLYGKFPQTSHIVMMIGAAFCSVLIGTAIFNKIENRFVEEI